MKKESICRLLYTVAALLAAGFAVASGVDAYRYDTGGYVGSAPLYLYILVNAIVYLLPSLALFLAAILCRKKFASKGASDETEGGPSSPSAAG